MHILFLTHYFPPEVNAPASRTFESARRWVRDGHQVTVLTCVPNHPSGIVYPGYSNRRLWRWDEREGIRILRVFTLLSANKGVLRRMFNFLSYFVSAVLLCGLARHVDLVVSTSPQFFCGLAGYPISRLKRRPWVLEIRDLWPDSISAVGAIRQKGALSALTAIESFMYRNADHVVPVTQAFKEHIAGRGVPREAITVITNGADLETYSPQPKDNALRAELGLAEAFVVSYVGTHGMAHSLETVLYAAQQLGDDSGVMFLLVGGGAEREKLLALKQGMGLKNVIMLPQQEKAKIPAYLAASDACVVLLRNTPLFKTVIPSKMFEAMAVQRPIILGVLGESRRIVEEGRCGLCIEPENPQQLAQACLRLKSDPALCATLGENGRRLTEQRYNRESLAMSYKGVLERVAARRTGAGG